MAKPTLKQLEAFVEVAATGQFALAAARLNTTQPNISSRLASLEVLVGEQLFDRKTQPVLPTLLGQDLLPHAKAVLDSAAKFSEATRNPKLSPQVLRLGVAELVVHTFLSDFMSAFQIAHPELNLELVVDLSTVVEQSLADGHLDLAICNQPIRNAALARVPLASFDWICAAAPHFHGQFGAMPILTSARGTAAFAQTQDQFASTHDAPRLVPSSTLAATRQMALQGMGHGLLPRALILEDLASGKLVEVKTDWLPEPLAFLALFDPSKPGEWAKDMAELARSSLNNEK